IKTLVLEVTARTLGRERVDESTPFRELGVDSLMALEIRNQLSKAIGAKLSATLVYDHPTVERLSNALWQDLFVSRPAPAPDHRALAPNDAVAIVGMGCRFPGGANDPDAFWRLLARGDDAICDPPFARWGGRGPSIRGGYVPDIDTFDAELFGIG